MLIAVTCCVVLCCGLLLFNTLLCCALLLGMSGALASSRNGFGGRRSLFRMDPHIREGAQGFRQHHQQLADGEASHGHDEVSFGCPVGDMWLVFFYTATFFCQAARWLVFWSSVCVGSNLYVRSSVCFDRTCLELSCPVWCVCWSGRRFVSEEPSQTVAWSC